MAQTWHSANFAEPTFASGDAPSELMMIAEQMGLEDDELRQLLRDVIQQRLREKGAAEERLDRVLEKRANGSSVGNDLETTPGPHQQRI